MRADAFVVAALLCCAPTVAKADVMYTYVGQNFTTVFGVYTTSDHVSGEFTFATPFAPNLNLASENRATSWDFTDGIQTSTADDSGFSMEVSTDALGNVTEYLIQIATQGDGEISAEHYHQCPYCGDSAGFRSLVSEQYAYNEVPGRLTEVSSVAPEPSTFVLLGSGVLGALGVVRRQFV